MSKEKPDDVEIDRLLVEMLKDWPGNGSATYKGKLYTWGCGGEPVIDLDKFVKEADGGEGATISTS